MREVRVCLEVLLSGWAACYGAIFKAHRFRALCLAAVLVLCAGGLGVGAELPAAKQAVFLARIIAYDGNLKERAAGIVDIGILSRKGDKASEQMAESILKAFSPLESATLAGLPVKLTKLSFVGRDALDKAVRDEHINTIYVCGGLDANLSDITSVARSRKALTIASQQDHLKHGLSLGVFDVDGKNTILVNLDASREEGVAFGPELLRLATVVR
jgi:YfiR/HmsC-like